MAEVLIGGAFGLVTALLSGWLVDGGRKRRVRRAIREEFELAGVLDAAWPETAKLRALAQRRLDRYVTPLPQRIGRLSRPQKFLAIVLTVVVVAGAVFATLALVANFSTSTWQNVTVGFASALGVGLYAGVAYVLLQTGLVSFVEALSRGMSLLNRDLARTLRVVSSWYVFAVRRVLRGRYPNRRDTDRRK